MGEEVTDERSEELEALAARLYAACEGTDSDPMVLMQKLIETVQRERYKRVMGKLKDCLADESKISFRELAMCTGLLVGHIEQELDQHDLINQLATLLKVT